MDTAAQIFEALPSFEAPCAKRFSANLETAPHCLVIARWPHVASKLRFLSLEHLIHTASPVHPAGAK